MPKNGLNVSLNSYDDIFSTEEARQEEQREQVQQISIEELHPFKDHPFKVLDDEAMQHTVESIKLLGVTNPLIARPRPEGGYEIISGHRRQHAAQLAGLKALPVIVRQMDDDAAVLLMVDSNLQREQILPSERAFAYKMKLDALKRQGARSDLTSTQVAQKLSVEKVGEDAGVSKDTIRRFIRLTNLMYERLASTATSLRNGLIALADQTFPSIDQAFGHAIKNADGHEKWVDFFSIYWHRDCVLRLSIEKFTESYRKWCLRRNYKFRTNTAHKLYALAQDAVPTLPKNNGTKALVLQACKSLNAVCEAKQSTQEEMNRLASLLPEYEVVMQMEGTGPITGPALMAEIGDVRRFKNKKALVAFAGIDAPPFQSGNFESKSRHVSKRGSPHLRRAVFLVANIILTLSHKDNSVFCFMDKKRAEGKHYYVYTIAGSAKFLRIYYARVTEYLRTQEIPVAASCLNGNS